MYASVNQAIFGSDNAWSLMTDDPWAEQHLSAQFWCAIVITNWDDSLDYW